MNQRGVKVGAAAQVALVQQGRRRAARQGHEIGVGHVLVAVGVGEAFGFADEVYAHHGGLAAVGVHGGGLVAGQVEIFQRAQGRGHGHATRRGCAHAADPVAAVGGADRVALLGLVIGQVAQLGQARGDGEAGAAAAGHLDLLDDVLCDRAGVQRVGAAAGQRVQGCRIGGVLDHRAQGLGGAVGIEEVRGRLGIGEQQGA